MLRLSLQPSPTGGGVSKQCRQDDEGIEVGRSFDRPAVAQGKAVDGGPFETVAPESGVERELDEDQIIVARPAIDPSMQVGEAAAEPRELSLSVSDAGRPGCERLDEHHIVIEEFW